MAKTSFPVDNLLCRQLLAISSQQEEGLARWILTSSLDPAAAAPWGQLEPTHQDALPLSSRELISFAAEGQSGRGCASSGFAWRAAVDLRECRRDRNNSITAITATTLLIC